MVRVSLVPRSRFARLTAAIVIGAALEIALVQVLPRAAGARGPLPPRSALTVDLRAALLTPSDLATVAPGAASTSHWRPVEAFLVSAHLCGVDVPQPAAVLQAGFDAIGATASLRQAILTYDPGQVLLLDRAQSGLAGCTIFDVPLVAGGSSNTWAFRPSAPLPGGNAALLEAASPGPADQRRARFYFIRRDQYVIFLLYVGPSSNSKAADGLARLAQIKLDRALR